MSSTSFTARTDAPSTTVATMSPDATRRTADQGGVAHRIPPAAR